MRSDFRSYVSHAMQTAAAEQRARAKKSVALWARSIGADVSFSPYACTISRDGSVAFSGTFQRALKWLAFDA